MGKKYIIELEEPEMFDERKYYQCSQMPWWAVSENIVENLTPYTEPDIKQVNAEKDKIYDEARARGYDEGRARGYQEGLFDAWEAARKIIHMPEADLLNLFPECYAAVCTSVQVFLKYDASECIEKIWAYEQEKEEQIQVGDEVELKCGVSPAIYMQGANGSDEIYLLFNDGSCGMYSRSEIERKTGRHFHEISEVLQKMKETDNG